MRSLRQSLQDHDHGQLRIIAHLWDIDPPQGDAAALVEVLSESLSKPDHLHDMLGDLPPEARAALQHLAEEGGRLPWIDFVQRHGEMREMGPGRRDRDQPWRDPISPVETLWYRGLIARAFGDSPVGPKEFAFIPQELLDNLPSGPPAGPSELGRPGSRPHQILRLENRLVDDATTLLAALRRRPEPGSDLPSDRQRSLHPFFAIPSALPALTALLQELGPLRAEPLEPKPDQVGEFLESSHGEALYALAQSWRNSSGWNDFNLLGHLEPGPGGWPNDPHASRGAALDFLKRVPRNRWWDLEAFLADVRERYPSFQRPGGDFDSWYLRDRRTGTFLRGVSSWDAVDGALLRAMITGPLHWLGAVDLGLIEGGEHPSVFRLTEPFGFLVDAEVSPQGEQPTPPGRLLPDGTVELPRLASRKIRYQVARLCSWQGYREDVYTYRLRPSAVLAGAEQGLELAHVRRLLEEVSPEPTPPGLLRALDRLTENHIEARAERLIVLRVGDPELLDRIASEPRTGRWIEERLGPTAAAVPSEHLDDLLETAAALGLLVEPPPPRPGHEP